MCCDEGQGTGFDRLARRRNEQSDWNGGGLCTSARDRVVMQICPVLAERVDRKRVLAKVKQKASLLLAEGLAEKALEKYSELIKTGESDAGALGVAALVV